MMSNDEFIVENKITRQNVIFDSQLLTMLMLCPRKYLFTFIHNRRLKGGKSNALECGSIVHAIKEFYYKAIMSGASRSDAIAIGFAAGEEYLKPYQLTNKYITDENHEGVKNVPIESSDKPKRTGWKHVFKTMEEYFDYYASDKEIVIGVEEVRGKLIYEDDEIRILYKAKFDLIMDDPTGLMSRDHKTMSQNRESISLNNQFIGQCVILGTRQMEINKIGFQKSLPANEKFIRVRMPYSPDRIAEWCNEIVPYYSRMLLAYKAAEYFPPNFTNCQTNYGYCDFKKVCEHDRAMRLVVLEREYEAVEPWDIDNED